ncbi:MAG: arginine repressor [Clostridiales bacterium]|nr:arginine repressor [Clostridiales bacterium]MCF8021190.1 arginine repressor [Clostridiales bacterium]
MKAGRQKKILDIIDNKTIETQQQLASELYFAGFDVTQATLSRDIRELGLVKVAGASSSSYYALPGHSISIQNDERLRWRLTNAVISIDFSENLIVIKTYPGEAQGVAHSLDNIDWKEIIGTVGGDDTVLLIIKPKRAVPGIIEKITALSGR